MKPSFLERRQENRLVLLGAVEQVKEVLKAETAAAEKARTLPRTSVDALRSVGLFNMKLPIELGGAETDPVTQIEVIEAVTEINPSAAWCMFIGAAIVGLAGAFLPQKAVDQIFLNGGVPNMAGALMPGRAVRVDGGYHVTGRWSWASGILHADWALVQTLVTFGSSVPEPRTVVFPAKQAEIIDNWHVVGLRATGSCDFTVSDLFVPEEFTYATENARPERGGALFRMGWPGYVANEHAAFAFGLAKAALAVIRDLGRSKTRGYGPQRALGGRSAFQRMIAESELKLRGTRMVAVDLFERAWREASAGSVPGPALQAEMRCVASLATDTAKEIIAESVRFGAGSAVREESQLQRCLRDINTAAAHLMVSDSAYENYGQALLGQPDFDPMA